jgi:hypothetical protein
MRPTGAPLDRLIDSALDYVQSIHLESGVATLTTLRKAIEQTVKEA